jgi:hypothetical protein
MQAFTAPKYVRTPSAWLDPMGRGTGKPLHTTCLTLAFCFEEWRKRRRCGYRGGLYFVGSLSSHGGAGGRQLLANLQRLNK